ncbi:glycoside hydrolase domain-containing protein [Odoribacter laneus]|uniref:DUF4091 domain-containing protein n=1 Tax=Odoribacter laneus TaxID=626933 RepID=UPI003AB8A45E
MKKVVFILYVCVIGLVSIPEKGNAQCFRWQPEYEELTDARKAAVEEWSKLQDSVFVSWGSTDVRYVKTEIPHSLVRRQLWKGRAWRGERVNAQAFIRTLKDLKQVEVSVSDLEAVGGGKITAQHVNAGFVRYVMTDELNKDKRGTCGYRPDRTLFDSSLVADVIDRNVIECIEAKSVRPLWVTVRVPSETPPGIYRGKLTFNREEIAPLTIELNVSSRQLPAPGDWAFRLDLWQNPYAVARFYDLPLWSEEHLEAMRPLMQLLADAGQKTITASIMHKPWGGQTEDYFKSMVMRVRTLEGKWIYDYAVFDKWVEFMMELGIDRQINCYTMIPWDLSFRYFDQASDSFQSIRADVGSPEYIAYWQPFLMDFARHLKEKGWFEITTIAMDERPMKAMQKAIRIIREADPAFQIALAGNYHADIEADIFDYCLASAQVFPEKVLQERRKSGKISTYYTCCSESYPNTFTFSPPAESAWLGWYAAAKNFDGYLRWAYNSWTKDPLRDSRFRAFGGGDCYLVYPGGRSSIRMERLIEGIQDYEKIRILKNECEEKNNTAGLKRIEKMLADFEIDRLPEQSAAEMIRKARQLLNKL